ncbi:MAG: DUF4234 domain-containing protein [Candidatus Babeliales bacterium]|nr:DUF4234 domain-containing protein [Candidatus Babeliales bacterium]
MHIKHRSILEIAILTVITFGIYPFVWLFKTRNEINSLGADIPTAWLIFVPFGNIYFYYKYCEGFSTYVKRSNSTLEYFILTIIVFIGIKSFASTAPIACNFVFPAWMFTAFAISGYASNLMYLFIPMMVFQIGLNELLERKD